MKRSDLALSVCLVFVGCASIGPPLAPSLELAKPPNDLRASRKGNMVTLTWTVPVQTTDGKIVGSQGATRICRGVGALEVCGKPAGEIPAEARRAVDESRRMQTATYADTLPTDIPEDAVIYAVEVLNRDGRSAGLSNPVMVSAARTVAPPTVRASAVKDGILVTWNLASEFETRPAISYRVRIFRRDDGGGKKTLVAEVPLASDTVNSGQFIDRMIEWEKTYVYQAAMVTVVAGPSRAEVQMEGDDSAEVKILAHDVFPPSTPTELQAVFSPQPEPGFIDLIWSPVSDTDLAGYRVYRHEEGEAPVLLNAKPASASSYRDMQVTAGKEYFYSVTAVDVRGNESGKSPEASEQVR